MLRARLLASMLAAALGLVGGCTSLSNHPWFGKRPASCGTCGADGACCSSGCPVGCADSCAPSCSPGCEGGPALESYPPMMTVPPSSGAIITAPPMPQNATMPPLASPPRLVPQPQQSQPLPYTPVR